MNFRKFLKGASLIALNPWEFARRTYHYAHTTPNPVIIYTEVTTNCNNRCFFCAENNTTRRGLIKENVKKRVAKMLSSNPDKKFKIYFHLLGEPLLYDGLEGYITLLSSFPNAELWMSTNGVLLDSGRLSSLRKAGLWNIWFTMFYTNEADYNKNTRSNNYKTARDNLQNLLSRNTMFTRIHIVTFSDTAEEIEKAMKKKINVTLQKNRTSKPWKYEGRECEKQICISINGDVTFSYKDYDFEYSIGNICGLDNAALIDAYSKA